MDDITRALKEGKIPLGMAAGPAPTQARYDPSLPIEGAVALPVNGQPVIVGGVNNIEVIAREVFSKCLELVWVDPADENFGANREQAAADMAVDCALALKRSLATRMAAEAQKAQENATLAE